MKFIHTADWQIGMKAVHVGSVGSIVREERIHAAKRVVQLATEHQVGFLLVAGDTFEDNAVSRLVVQKVGDILAGFSGPVYLISGNHDPLVPGSVWEHPVWQSHPNLHVLGKREPLDVPGGKLYPCPLFEKYSSSDPTQWIEASQCSEISVGLAHGTVVGVSPDNLDYPIDRNAAQRSGLDYLALGHWHSYATFPNSQGENRLVYSGTHETTKFGERDSGNVLLVEIDQRGAAPNITPLVSGGLTWLSSLEEIHEEGDFNKICRMVEEIEKPNTTLLDFHLSGILYPDDRELLNRIEEIVASRFLFGRIDHDSLLPNPTDDRWLESIPGGVLKEVVQHLQNLSNPGYQGAREDYATPAVAASAITQFYRMLHEVKS